MTLKDLTNYRVEVNWATQLYGRGELAKRISVQRRNRIARTIRNAYNELEMVKEDEVLVTRIQVFLPQSNILTTKRP